MTRGKTNKTNTKKQTKKSVREKLNELVPIPWPLNLRQTYLVALGAILLVSVFVFWRFLSGQDLFIFEDKGSDSITLFYPNFVHIAKYYTQVGFPGWSFYLGLGQSFYPGALLNPWDLLFIPMGPKTIAVAITYVQWIKLIGSGFLFALFLRKLGVEKPVIVIGALCWTFGGYLIVGSSWYIHSTHIFWITLSFLAFEMLLRDQKWWLMPWPFLFLLGTRAYFLVLFLIVYAAVRTFDFYGVDWKKLIKVYARLLICGLIALALAAPFLSVRFNRLYNSARVTGNVSKLESLSNRPMFATGNEKQNGTAILRWFSSDVLGTGDDYKGYRNYLEGPLFYIGLISLLLLPQFFWFATKRQRWLYGGLLFVWFWILLFPWFRYAFYGFAGDYYKGALSIYVPFSVLLPALMAFDLMVKGRKPNLIILVLSLLFLLVLLWYPYSMLEEGLQRNIQLIASVFLLLETFVLAALHSTSFRKIGLPLLIGLVAVEAGTLSYFSYRTRVSVPAADLHKPVLHFDNTKLGLEYIRQQDNPMFYRVEKAYGSVKSGFNDALVQQFFGSKMYQSQNSKYYVRFLEEMGIIPKGDQASSRWIVGITQRNTLHPLFSVKYFLANEDGSEKINKNIYEKLTQIQNIEVYRNKYFIPFGVPFTQYFTESEFLPLEPNEKLEAMNYGFILPDHDASSVPAIKHGDIQALNFGSGIGDTWRQLGDKAMEMTYFSQNHIKGKIKMAEPGMVFFSMPFNPNWKVTVDGLPVEFQLVNLGFCGLPVGEGEHQIDMKFVPPYFVAGWVISGFALLVFIFLVYRRVRLFPVAA